MAPINCQLTHAYATLEITHPNINVHTHIKSHNHLMGAQTVSGPFRSSTLEQAHSNWSDYYGFCSITLSFIRVSVIVDQTSTVIF